MNYHPHTATLLFKIRLEEGGFLLGVEEDEGMIPWILGRVVYMTESRVSFQPSRLLGEVVSSLALHPRHELGQLRSRKIQIESGHSLVTTVEANFDSSVGVGDATDRDVVASLLLPKLRIHKHVHRTKTEVAITRHAHVSAPPDFFHSLQLAAETVLFDEDPHADHGPRGWSLSIWKCGVVFVWMWKKGIIASADKKIPLTHIHITNNSHSWHHHR